MVLLEPFEQPRHCLTPNQRTVAFHSMMLDAGRHSQWLLCRAAAVSSLVCGAALAACSDSVGATDDSYDIAFDFSTDYQGWVPGFVDYPVGKEAEWAIGSSLAPLPAPLDPTRKGILLTGANHSDDLFMYISREGPGVSPNASYVVRYRVTVATNAPRNCAGIGGAPGESVVLKVGATPVEPARIVEFFVEHGFAPEIARGKTQNDEMPFDTPLFVAHDHFPVAGKRDRLDVKGRLFANLADDGIGERFAGFDGAARQRVEIERGIARAAHDQHVVAADDRGAYRQKRTLRIGSLVGHAIYRFIN